MPAFFDHAAIRHYKDAETLAGKKRYDNAGHLIGFAAECAIKHAIVIFHQDEPPHLHLPDLANKALLKIHGRNAHYHPMRKLLETTRNGFFDDWRVTARYEADGVKMHTYEKWEKLARRAISAAGLTLAPSARR
jgi:HEPN domain-containing protein